MAFQVALLAGLCVILAASTGTESRTFYGLDHPGFYGQSERSLDPAQSLRLPWHPEHPRASLWGGEDEQKAPELIVSVIIIEKDSSDAEQSGEHKTGGEEGGKLSGAGQKPSKTDGKEGDGSGKQSSAVQQDGSKTQSELNSSKPSGDGNLGDGKTQGTQQSGALTASPTATSDQKNTGKSTSSAPTDDSKSQKAQDTTKNA